MTFEFDAEKYKKASTHQKEWGKKLISEINLKGRERILDLGCGDGGITAELAELVPDGLVVGIDASRSMIDSAEKTHKAQNLRFDLMDINKIDFENEFDVVFSNATLHWIKNHNKLLSNVCNALKAGGIVRFNFAGDGNCSTFYKVVCETMAEKKYAGYFNNFDWPWYMPTIEGYEKLLMESKFKETRVWGDGVDVECECGAAYEVSIDSSWAGWDVEIERTDLGIKKPETFQYKVEEDFGSLELDYTAEEEEWMA